MKINIIYVSAVILFLSESQISEATFSNFNEGITMYVDKIGEVTQDIISGLEVIAWKWQKVVLWIQNLMRIKKKMLNDISPTTTIINNVAEPEVIGFMKPIPINNRSVIINSPRRCRQGQIFLYGRCRRRYFG